MSNVCVVGLQWGDEGKGKIVDALSEKFDIVVRYQGGSNAGHTVVIGDQKFVLHLIPSGVLHPGKLCVIGNGVALDPGLLLSEINELRSRGVEVGENLVISDRAHLVFPYHKRLDALDSRRANGERIGTTGRGIGPCYADKMARLGIRVADLYHKDTFRQRLAQNVAEKNKILVEAGEEPLRFEDIFDEFMGHAEWMRPHVRDTSELLINSHSAGKKILFEGAQGALLDVDFGTYPFITCSNASACGVPSGAGVPPKLVGHVLGVMKAYATRVGEGPFATELHDGRADELREKGGEYGATTGRPRRCGWFDAVAVRHAAMVSGVDSIALTKLDVLGGQAVIKFCTGYIVQHSEPSRTAIHSQRSDKGAAFVQPTKDGEILQRFPADSSVLALCKPIYEEMPGWSEDISRCRSFAELPVQAQRYVEALERCIGLRISTISVGRARDQIITR